MAYNDIVKRKTYEEFLKDAKTPYRSTKNEYPLGKRDYSHRKYIVHDGYIEIKLYDNILGKEGPECRTDVLQAPRLRDSVFL